MTVRTAAEIFPPGEFLREELEARGWTQSDFAEILGRPIQLVNEIVLGKRAITPETAQGVADALGTSPQLWLNLESAYQLSRLKQEDNSVARRARLYEKAPVKEMVRRRWIEQSNNVGVIEQRVMEFYGLTAIDQNPQFWPFAARASSSMQEASPAHWAWLFRARYLARGVQATKFTDARFEEGIARLKALLPNPEEIRHVPRILSEAGIRFLVLESLSHTRIDGACFWLNQSSPVVVLSLRYDRIDGFWFTLFHELGHVLHRHGLTEYEPVDTNLVGNGAQPFEEKSAIEQLVDKFAVEHLVPKKVLDYFIARVKPLYYKTKINDFARHNGVHPGIVVGQLQFRKEIPYSHNREMLISVKDVITRSALTDGWGNVPVAV
jgi:HTH-type transcriptional regulator/antitoxin HigA